jgi:hypothetical protein
MIIETSLDLFWGSHSSPSFGLFLSKDWHFASLKRQLQADS